MTRLRKPPFPSENEPWLLADWIEATVLATWTPVSRASLKSLFAREDVEDVEARVADVWGEIRRRGRLCGDGSPLALMEEGDNLEPRGKLTTALFYYFLCLLSIGEEVDNRARELFEHCVTDLAFGLSGFPAVRIGAPRRPPVPVSLELAVEQYTASSVERLAVRPLEPNDKDLGLDVATWHPYPDGRGGYLHFLGQCATGRDWFEDRKLFDLNLDVWKQHVAWLVSPVRFFALPFVVPETRWWRTCAGGGLVLDRPRLLELYCRRALPATRLKEIRSWCGTVAA